MSNIELYIAELEATGHTLRAAQVRARLESLPSAIAKHLQS